MAIIVATGRLGKDAEVRTTQGGTKVVSFSLADDIGWGDRKKTNWLKCAMFGERGVKVAPYLTKGSIVQISGEPEVEAWEKDGKAHGCIKVAVNDVKLFGGGKKDDDAPVAQQARQTRKTVDEHTTGGFDDEIPF